MKRYLCALIALLALVACGEREPLSKNGFLLDTIVTITLYEGGGEDLLEEAFAVCARYEGLFSRTKPESEVYRLNHNGGEAMRVSKDTAEVIRLALHYAALTDGKFDITVCPVMDLWDFQGDSPVLPDPARVEGALARVGWRNVVLEGETVRLEGGAQIDLGGIAKGYIADRLAELLGERGVKSAIINLGGNIMTVGGRPSGEPFSIGIQKPFERHSETIGSVEITGRSVVSSGVYERSFRLDGRLYHHIMDPATGYPAETGLSSVTIVSDRSADGDALSTSCFLLGLEEGMALLESLPGMDGVFIDQQGEEYFTSGFGETLRYRASG